MSIVRRLVELHDERRSFYGPWGPYSDGRIPPPSWGGGGSTAGVVVNEATSLQLIDAYACVSLLCDSVGMLPFTGYRATEAFRERLPVQPSIVDRPDPETERIDFFAKVVSSMALRGNAYAAITAWDARAVPTALSAIHPDDADVRRNGKTGRRELRLRNGAVLNDREFVHIPWVTLAGGLKGLSPIECARRGIGLSIATEQFGARWFEDGAAPSSVLQSKEAVNDEQARKTMARWVASHGGRRRPALLSGGLEWKPVTLTPNESQFLETQKLNTDRVARIWRVPPHRIGAIGDHASQGGANGLEEQGIGYVVFTLGPYLTRIEAAFSRLLPRSQYTKFNVGALLRGNTKDRYLSYAIGRQWGWLSVNDIRALEDLPPVDGGDVYLQPLNMVDAEKALQLLLKEGNQNG